MNLNTYTRGLLAALLGLSLAACQGETGPTGAQGAPGQDGQDGQDGQQGPIGPQGPGATLPPGAGYDLTITKAEVVNGKFTVTFKAVDAQGNGVDVVAQNAKPRFTLASVAATGKMTSVLVKDQAGANYVLDGVSTAPAMAKATQATYDSAGTFTSTGVTGVFTYAFAATVAIDSQTNYAVGAFGSRAFDGYTYPAAATFTFGPAAFTLREVVNDAACNKCHGTLMAHGTRKSVALCATCHDAQTKDPETGNAVDFPVMVHKIHGGKEIKAYADYLGVPYTYTIVGYQQSVVNFDEVGFPRMINDCKACHQGANADAYYKKPSLAACSSCHFTLGDGSGHPSFAVTATTDCATCHVPGSSIGADVVHATVAAPAATNALIDSTASANVNAGWLPAAGYEVPGAAKITYDIKSVSRDSAKHPVMVFKMMKDGQAVTFPAYDAANTKQELMTGFIGAPSVYFAFAVPQDGIATPADFNATASVYLKNVVNHVGTGTAAATIDGPVDGYYTVTLTGVIVPDTATMLTGGLGYTYNVTSTLPLTQIDLAKYPPEYDTTGKYVKGGLVVIPPKGNWKVATGNTGRRTIVSNDKCNACHAQLGAAPTFHAGQRNDAPTCSFCHNPNRTSSAWSANVKDFVHGIHGAAARTEDYTWHQISPTEGFWQVTYPNKANNCEACHLTGTYDYSANAKAVPNLLASTVGQGTYAVGSAHSPYVAEGVIYGAGFKFDAATGVPTDAASTTLVVSPVTAACSACHDSELALAHMGQNGGSFYASRAEAAQQTETCLLCHGKGKVAAIDEMHK